MHAHLRVVAIPVADADSLGDLETAILSELDPPLNLDQVGQDPAPPPALGPSKAVRRPKPACLISSRINL